MKVFLTGMTGHLGFNILRYLCEAGHSIVALARDKDFAAKLIDLFLSDYASKITVVSGDLLNLESLVHGSERCQVVINTAAIVGLRGEDSRKQIETNIRGMENILKSLKENKIPRLIHVSSVQTIASGSLDAPADESLRYEQAVSSDPYGFSKVEAEKRIESMDDPAIESVIVHPGFIVGPYDIRGSAMTKIIDMTSRGAGIFYPSGGIAVTDVEEAARAIVSIAAREKVKERYILTGANLSYREIFNMLHETTGSPKPVIPIPTLVLKIGAVLLRFFEKNFHVTFGVSSHRLLLITRQEYYSSHRARKDLGFKDNDPAGALKQGYLWLKGKKDLLT